MRIASLAAALFSAVLCFAQAGAGEAPKASTEKPAKGGAKSEAKNDGKAKAKGKGKDKSSADSKLKGTGSKAELTVTAKQARAIRKACDALAKRS